MSRQPDAINLEELQHMQRFVAAGLITPGGEYLAPIFDRLETEIATAQAAIASIARARALLTTAD